MIVLGYIGKHKGDGLKAHAGWVLIRKVQRGFTYRPVTHCEVFLSGDCNSAEIGSSSLVDGGVRIKTDVKLNPANWIAVYLPDTTKRNQAEARDWFLNNDHLKYDTRGAIGSITFGLGQNEGYFCNEACGAALGQIDPHTMPPAGFIAWCLDQPGSKVVTDEFFKSSTYAT